jgi:hypothetical protein
MGGGSFTMASFCDYSTRRGKMVDIDTGFVTRGQTFESRNLDESLSPKNVIRECCNSKEHPNTLPVILALDVTGSMGTACQRTAEALGSIMRNLLEKHKKDDIEFMVMGIGDMECDRAPVQASQFESDVRIAEALDKIYMEHGGGGNAYESYSAAWLFGLKQTKLDCFDKQGKKGVIITMGDEPLNPILQKEAVRGFLGENCKVQDDVKTDELYEQASKKFDIYHISIDDDATCYSYNKRSIEETFGELLGDKAKVASINTLPKIIEDCITETIKNRGGENAPSLNEGTIKW